jgi:hypothetical protein
MALHVPVYLNDKPEGDNIMFDPSVADDLNPTTKVTTVTEDAKGNKKTIINENKNASDLLKQQQQEAYDREEPGRQAHKAKVEHSKYPSAHIGTSYSKGEGFPESSNPLWSSIPSGDVFSGDITDRWAAQPTNEVVFQAPYTAQTPYTPQQLAGMKQKAIDAYNEKQSKMVVFTKANGSKGKAIPGSPEAKALLAEGYVQGGQGKANQTLPSVTEDPRVVAIKDMNDRATDAGDTAYDSMTYIPTEWGGNRQAFEDARDDARVFAEKKIKKDTDLPTATDTSSVFEKDTGTFNNSLTSPEEDIVKEAVVITREDADKILAEKSNAKEKKELDAWVASIKKPGVSNSQAEMSAQALLKSLAPIKYKKPSLFKAIAIGVGTALFGGSAMDSLNAGLSSIGDEALRVDKLNAERDKQRTKFQYDAALEKIKNGTGGKIADKALSSFIQNSAGDTLLWKGNKFNQENFMKRMTEMNVPQSQWTVYAQVAAAKKSVASIELSDTKKKENTEIFKGLRKDMIKGDDDKKFHKGFSQLATEFTSAGLAMDYSERGLKNRASFESAITDWMRDYQDWEKGGGESWGYHGTNYEADEGYQILSPIPYFWRTVGLMTESTDGSIKAIDASEAKDFGIREITAIKSTLNIMFPNDKKGQHAFQVKVRKKWMEEANKNETEGQGKAGYHYDDFLYAESRKLTIGNN